MPPVQVGAADTSLKSVCIPGHSNMGAGSEAWGMETPPQGKFGRDLAER